VATSITWSGLQTPPWIVEGIWHVSLLCSLGAVAGSLFDIMFLYDDEHLRRVIWAFRRERLRMLWHLQPSLTLLYHSVQFFLVGHFMYLVIPMALDQNEQTVNVCLFSSLQPSAGLRLSVDRYTLFRVLGNFSYHDITIYVWTGVRDGGI